jgi:LytR cell envelope-related transcriptional attenuator
LEGAAPAARNSLRAMEETWRKATIVVTVVAAVELVALAGLAMALLGNPLSRHFREEAASAAAPRVRTGPAVLPTKTTLTRADTAVIVLNANGRAGAASNAADRVSARGYIVASVGNAPESSPRTIVMFRRGYAAEGLRLGRDLRLKLVRPLDGMRATQLMGAHLVLLIGR